MVVRQSNLYNGNPYMGKMHLFLLNWPTDYVIMITYFKQVVEYMAPLWLGVIDQQLGGGLQKDISL